MNGKKRLNELEWISVNVSIYVSPGASLFFFFFLKTASVGTFFFIFACNPNFVGQRHILFNFWWAGVHVLPLKCAFLLKMEQTIVCFNIHALWLIYQFQGCACMCMMWVCACACVCKYVHVYLSTKKNRDWACGKKNNLLPPCFSFHVVLQESKQVISCVHEKTPIYIKTGIMSHSFFPVSEVYFFTE